MIMLSKIIFFLIIAVIGFQLFMWAFHNGYIFKDKVFSEQGRYYGRLSTPVSGKQQITASRVPLQASDDSGASAQPASYNEDGYPLIKLQGSKYGHKN